MARLLNVWIGYSVGHEADSLNVATAVVIALASVLQAGAGGLILRRAIGYPAPLDNPRDLLFFLLLAPLFCLASASIPISGMWALGILKFEDIAINWLTWWVGDTLGVLVALPLMLVLFGEPRRLRKLRVWYVAVPMIVCFALFVAVFIRVKSWEKTESLTEFYARSQQLADSLRADFDDQGLFLKELSSVFINRDVAIPDGFEFWHSPLPRADGAVSRVFGSTLGLAELDTPCRRSCDLHCSAWLYWAWIHSRGAMSRSAVSSRISKFGRLWRCAVESGNIIATAPIRLVQDPRRQAGAASKACLSGPVIRGAHSTAPADSTDQPASLS